MTGVSLRTWCVAIVIGKCCKPDKHERNCSWKLDRPIFFDNQENLMNFLFRTFTYETGITLLETGMCLIRALSLADSCDNV